MKPTWEWDEQAKAGYAKISGGVFAKTVSCSKVAGGQFVGMVNIDVDKDGRILGVEIIP